MVSFFEEREKGRKKETKGEREKIDWFDIPLQPWKNDVDPLIGFPANRVRPLSLVSDPACRRSNSWKLEFPRPFVYSEWKIQSERGEGITGWKSRSDIIEIMKMMFQFLSSFRRYTSIRKSSLITHYKLHSWIL